MALTRRTLAKLSLLALPGARLALAGPGQMAPAALLVIFLRGGADGLSLVPPLAGEDRKIYEAEQMALVAARSAQLDEQQQKLEAERQGLREREVALARVEIRHGRFERSMALMTAFAAIVSGWEAYAQHLRGVPATTATASASTTCRPTSRPGAGA